MSGAAIPVVVIGGTGYVAGELLRLIALNPGYSLLAATSRGEAGQRIGEHFPHLASAWPDAGYVSSADALALASDSARLALFSAAPHGASAQAIEPFLCAAARGAQELHVVDVSADYRFTTAGAFESVYGVVHGAPQRLAEFAAAVPEHLSTSTTAHIGNPGCFATAMLLGGVPLLAAGLTEPEIFATGITGSTGSGRHVGATTHHPERHSNLYAYKPLEHRHAAEVSELAAAATGVRSTFRFVPHSGPFARGIHMTLQAKSTCTAGREQLFTAFADYYVGSEFVRVVDRPPRVKDVAGSNYAHIAVATDGDSIAVFCVIDNLLKGAAGSAMQWMNRLFGLPDSLGLTAPAPGWI